MKKIFVDTLMENGSWSLKRVSAFVSFWLAQFYEFVLHTWLDHHTHEYVYEWLMGWSAFVIIGTVVDKKMLSKNILTQPGTQAVETQRVEKTTITKKTTDEVG